MRPEFSRRLVDGAISSIFDDLLLAARSRGGVAAVFFWLLLSAPRSRLPDIAVLDMGNCISQCSVVKDRHNS
jgi:hypothetical protein